MPVPSAQQAAKVKVVMTRRRKVIVMKVEVIQKKMIMRKMKRKGSNIKWKK
jgi:hypothetical protein